MFLTVKMFKREGWGLFWKSRMITAILIKGPGPAPFYATRQRRGIEIWSLARVCDQEEVKIVV